MRSAGLVMQDPTAFESPDSEQGGNSVSGPQRASSHRQGEGRSTGMAGAHVELERKAQSAAGMCRTQAHQREGT